MIFSERLRERMREQIRKKRTTKFEVAGIDYELRKCEWDDYTWRLVEVPVPGTVEIKNQWNEDEDVTPEEVESLVETFAVEAVVHE